MRNLDAPADFIARNFAGYTHTAANGKANPAYYITRDGFAILAMGFYRQGDDVRQVIGTLLTITDVPLSWLAELAEGVARVATAPEDMLKLAEQLRMLQKLQNELECTGGEL